jgi:UDP-glucuronate decarboxylase
MSENNKIVSEDLDTIASASLPWEKIYGKTVLITGANGFLAAYMVKAFLRVNERRTGPAIRVLGLVRNLQKAEKRFYSYLNRDDFELIVADITKPLFIEEKPDFIIHAASQASPKYYGVDPVGTLAANTVGTYHLLQLAAEKKVTKFLYFSSSEVYGAVADGDLISETAYGIVDPMNVRSCYAESKRMGETMCVSFSAQHNIPVTIARPFHTYGPGLSLDDGRVFADFVASIVAGRNIEMNSDGSAIRSFCYIADATEAFFTLLLKGADKEAYNIGNPEASLSIKELAGLLVDLYPEKNLKAVFKQNDKPYLQSTFNKLCPDINKANALGWGPKTKPAEGFKRTIESFII